MPETEDMIPALKIRNFRLFKELDIENLKRVNLFAGRNNTGKTALLEALRIFGEADNVSVLRYILEQRGEFKFEPWNFYDSVYYRPELERLKQDSQNPLVLSINHYELTRKFISERNVNYTLANTNSPNSEPLNAGNLFFQQQQPLFPNDRFVFVPFNAKEYFPLNHYWDKIALTPLEDDLINILKETILPNLVRLDVQQNERVVVRLKEESKPIPLKNLGDGAQRMFLMALALISAKDSVLLIDEIETGLHYAVLEDLWEMIFKYAVKLNIQVFATTHSQDTIRAFTYLLEKEEYEQEGCFFRLQANRKDGQIEAIALGKERLEAALETQSEIR